MADGAAVMVGEPQRSASASDLAWLSRDNDCDLTSFINSLWNQQLADGTFDFTAHDEQQLSTCDTVLGHPHTISPIGNTLGNAALPQADASAFGSADHVVNFDLDGRVASSSQDHDVFGSGELGNHANSTPQSYGVQCSIPALGDDQMTWSSVATQEASPVPTSVRQRFELSDVNEPCYARLLYSCLLQAPGHTMKLKEIYAWIRCHTHKARDPRNTGWQNSVRHNLSMNAAFERVQISRSNGESKKGSLWRLTSQALRDGVISTTRYRRDPKRKSLRRGVPAPQRQISGAKGGAATRAASHARRQLETHERMIRAAHTRAQQRLLTSAPAQRFAPATLSTHRRFPPSPYFLHPSDTSPVVMQHPCSSPHTPAQLQLGYEEQQKGMPDDFQLQHLTYHQGLLGFVDNMRDYTPSLQTESSCFTDECFSAQLKSRMIGGR